MTGDQQIPPAFAKGYALCAPTGRLQPKTWRATEAEAIAAKYRKASTWEKAQGKGWSVQFVYVRVFIPVFKSTYSNTSEACDEQQDI
ncbi:hypothetical protein [Agrobacterium tumefaciens]|uniref:hypothetical protein n=1 Tax=Agrobacterium tumefaciens TaxID=358 RepID=UPI00045AFA17|nr:hypothetical protein [Agrobacterium tumefaciens]CDN93502.1 hypothetical protein BN949_02656 [Agrobacterium tumefaciens]